MSANVESMFYTRKAPWHGLGAQVKKAPGSREALIYAGLDWNVIQKPVFAGHEGIPVEGFAANVRDTDSRVLGIVTDRYRVVQNRDAFAFKDALLGNGVKYETAGSLQGGRKVWLLAKLPQRYIMNGDELAPYLVFSNSHDGSGAIKVAITPVRVVCQNTLNLALDRAKRSWSACHTGAVREKLEDAKHTLLYAEEYMRELGREFERLRKVKVSSDKAENIVSMLLPIDNNMSEVSKKNIRRQQEDILMRYQKAPDLAGMDRNGYRFINAVSDFATHAEPIRRKDNYQESLFAKTVDGNPITDKAYALLKAVA
ncbi:MAG: DUF945 domain-containing protein [Lachnospiraceae bacterium]|nr:DUF945 domain-containing protein [Lachnospiraceae bacterium]